MVTNEQFLNKFGMPGKQLEDDLVMWDVPTELEIGVIPKRIFCNKVMIQPLTIAFKNLIDRGKVDELKTWDGCYNFRPIRGYEKQWAATGNVKYLSVHSWGCAIDVNAAWNRLRKKPTLSPEFVKCFTDAGFDWGGYWKRLDGMHFQLSSI